MRKFSTTVLAVTAVFVVAGFTHKTFSSEQTSYKLRVTSHDPDQELRFNGAIAFIGEGAPLYLTEESTPFEVDVRTEFVVGIFSTVERAPLLTVELLQIEGERSTNVALGTGARIFIGDGVHQPGDRVARAF